MARELGMGRRGQWWTAIGVLVGNRVQKAKDPSKVGTFLVTSLMFLDKVLT